MRGFLSDGVYGAAEKGYSASFRPSSEFSGEGGMWDDGSAGFEWKQRHLSEKRDMALSYMTDISRRQPIHDAIRVRSRLNRDRLMKPLGAQGLCEDRSVRPSTEMMDTLRISQDAFLTPARSEGSKTLHDAVRGSNSDDLDDMSDDLLSYPGSRPAGLSEERNRQITEDAQLEEELEELLADESVLETLGNLPEEDLAELRHEFYGGAPETSAGASGQAAEDGGPLTRDDSTDELLREWLSLRKETSPFAAYNSVPAGERQEWSAWYLRDTRSKRFYD